MRRDFIDALTYPRLVMLAQMDAEECPLYLYYQPSFPTCRHCDQASECRWLNDHDEFQVLAEQPLEHLHQALRFCMDYMEARVNLDGHNARRCVCESCTWLRSTSRLERQYLHESRQVVYQ